MEDIIEHRMDPVAFDKATLSQLARSLRHEETQQPSELSNDWPESSSAEQDFAIDPVSPTTASKTPALAYAISYPCC